MMSTFLSIFDDRVTKRRTLMPHRCKFCPCYFYNFHRLRHHTKSHWHLRKQYQRQVINSRCRAPRRKDPPVKKKVVSNGLHTVRPSIQSPHTKWSEQSAIQTGPGSTTCKITDPTEERICVKTDDHLSVNSLCNNIHPKDTSDIKSVWKHEFQGDIRNGEIRVKQEVGAEDETAIEFKTSLSQGRQTLCTQDSGILDLRINRSKSDIKIKQEFDNYENARKNKSSEQDLQSQQTPSVQYSQPLDLRINHLKYDNVKVKRETLSDSENKLPGKLFERKSKIQNIPSSQDESILDLRIKPTHDDMKEMEREVTDESETEQENDDKDCKDHLIITKQDLKPPDLRINPAKYYFSKSTPYRCLYCSKSFSKSSNRLIHQRAHLKDPFPWVCDKCCKKFRSRVALEVHTRIHTGEKPYSCPFCNSKFSTKGYLNVHIRGHTGELPYKCEFCGKSFRESCKLTVHLRTHTLEKPYKCRFCDNTFSQRGNCRKHERIHTGEKPFKCAECDKEYTNFRNFKRHEVMHTGVSAYRCAHCSLSFKFRRSLRTHEKVHTGGPVFVCVQCDGTFSSPSNLRRHKKDVHYSGL